MTVKVASCLNARALCSLLQAPAEKADAGTTGASPGWL